MQRLTKMSGQILVKVRVLSYQATLLSTRSKVAAEAVVSVTVAVAVPVDTEPAMQQTQAEERAQQSLLSQRHQDPELFTPSLSVVVGTVVPQKGTQQQLVTTHRSLYLADLRLHR